MSFGATLRALRERHGLSQGAVAERAGLTVSYVSRIENGRIQPTVAMVGRVADALGVPIAELFRPDPARPAPPHRCPVSHSGECIGRLIRERQGRPPGAGDVRYGEEELRLLKQADYLILHGSPRVRAALGTLIEALMEQSARPARR